MRCHMAARVRSARRGKRVTGRKTTEVTEPSAPAAKAQKAVDGDVAQQSATPPDDRHTIQALIVEEQLKKLIQNNQAQSNSHHDSCRQHRMERSPQTEHMLRYIVVFGIAENSACATSEPLAAHVPILLFEDIHSTAASRPQECNSVCRKWPACFCSIQWCSKAMCGQQNIFTGDNDFACQASVATSKHLFQSNQLQVPGKLPKWSLDLSSCYISG